MSNTYTIRNSDGVIVATINELERDRAATSLALHGRGSKEYGFDRNQNTFYQLEHFAGATGPANPIEGQLWWDTGNQEVCVWTGSPQAWTTVVPISQGLGFNVIAGGGLVGGGNPAGSPLTTTLDVVGGTGITVTANSISTNDSEIIHDNLSGFVANEHIDHSTISLIAGNGLTGGNTLTSFAELFFVGGTGITTSGFNVLVDSSVVRTTGNQTISGVKTWTNQIQGAAGSAAAPSYTFTGDTDTGIYNSGTNEISFSTTGTQRFRIESGGVLRSLNSAYETLVTEDDDIPNKKYVDSVSPSVGGVPPTSTTFLGSGSVSVLTIGKKYLIHVYGITRSAGTGMHTMGSVRITQGGVPGSGTLVAQTPTRYMNWPDGNVPQSAHFVITAPSTTIAGCTDYRGAGLFEVPSHMLAIQLD